MKTAISIPDPLFKEAEQLANQLRISRSQLYAKALRQFLCGHKHETVREALDTLYGKHDSAIASDLTAAQQRALGRETW